MHKIFFYNKFIIRLYMFRALCAHHQEFKIVSYSLWYHHTYRWPSGSQVEKNGSVFYGHLLDRFRHTVRTIMSLALQRVAVIRSCYNTDDLCRQKREKVGRVNYSETKIVLLKVPWLEMFSLLQYWV